MLVETMVQVTQRGRLGLMTLPKADAGVNLTGSLSAMAAALTRFAKDTSVYCVVLETDNLADGGSADSRVAHDYLWQLDRFIRPHIALVSGAVSGALTGIGPALHGTHRVGAEDFSLTLPEVGQGQIPLGGANYWLPRLPHRLGLYAAMTGLPLDRSLCQRLGILTHAIASSRSPDIIARLAEADPVDQVLDAIDEQAGASALDPYLEAIEHCFAAATPGAIIDRLARIQELGGGWAASAIARLQSAEPFALAVAHHMLTERAAPDLRSALLAGHRLARRWPAARAAANAAPAALDALLAPLPDGDLLLPAPKPPSIS